MNPQKHGTVSRSALAILFVFPDGLVFRPSENYTAKRLKKESGVSIRKLRY
jgi:hypothetical protein